MRKAEILRIVEMVQPDGKSAREVMLDAVHLALENGLSAAETVEVIDALEHRLGIRIHPMKFDD